MRTTVAVVMAVLLLTRRIGEILRVRTNTVDAPHRALVRSRSRLEAAVRVSPPAAVLGVNKQARDRRGKDEILAGG